MLKTSIAPDGKEYPLPTEEDNEKERKRLVKITKEERAKGRKIVAVQGLGFVGCVMAAVVADATDKDGNPIYYVHGHQRPSKRSFWKVPVINSGVTPVASSDPEVPEIFQRTVVEKKNLRATSEDSVYSLVDIVVVDIQLDATKPAFGQAEKGYCDITGFREGIRMLGQHINPDCLVLVETTVPPGTCEKVVKPILEEEFTKRGIDIAHNPPLVAHSYERVMPGSKYVSSIRDFWRVFSGVNKRSTDMCRDFLSNVLNVEEFPLTQLDSTNASELSKTMENSYRATNIALTLEWARFAEQIGVDIFKVRDAIRKRKGTHDNMLRPSLGVGGYCLTKDPVLANWAMGALFDLPGELSVAINSVNINDTMPLHTIDIIKKEFKEVKNLKISLLGVSYLENVGDTRHSPSKTLVEFLRKDLALVRAHDSYVEHWDELEEVTVEKDLPAVLEGAQVVIFAVGHDQYKKLEPQELIDMCKTRPLIVDCSNFLDDVKINKYKGLGCKVRGVGKGHIV